MLVHRHSDTNVASSNSSKAKRRRLLRKMPISQKSSPLLIISSSSKSTSDLTSNLAMEDVDVRAAGDCNQEILEVRLCTCAAA